MTDRHRGYIVTLEHDVRDDEDSAEIMAAIRMIRGVVSVKPVVTDYAHHMASQQVRMDLEKRLWDALKEKP